MATPDASIVSAPISPPKCFRDVLVEEITELKARRAALFPGQEPLPPAEPAPAHNFVDAHKLRPFGVAFSGGGIRSSTFNLGVLQGLAEVGLLPYIDYLSTVSGGGYVGSWLHGVIKNRHQGDPRLAQPELRPERIPGEPDADPITFLRKYSNYLAPKLGLFSPDFWTIAAVWLRNMILNLLILIPFLAGAVLTVLLAGIVQQKYRAIVENGPLIWLGPLIWAGPLLLAVAVVGVNLQRIVRQEFGLVRSSVPWPDLTSSGFVHGASACILFASYFLGAFRFTPPPPPLITGSILLVLFFLLQWLGGFGACYRARHSGATGWAYYLLIPLICALLTATLLWAAWKITGQWRDPDVEWVRIAFGPPLILLVWICGITLQIGLMGSDFPDAAREWLAALGSHLAIGVAFGIGIFLIAVFGPFWVVGWTLQYVPAGIALAGGWIGSGLAGYFSGNSEKTKGGPLDVQPDLKTWVLELAGKVAPIAFLAGFLLFVSLGTHLLLRRLIGSVVPRPDCVTPVAFQVPHPLAWLEPVYREYWCFLHANNELLLYTVLSLMAGCGIVAGLLPLRININEFSMHHFYKNRLVRCYLGASKADTRQPNRLTGFDPLDDFPISDMLPTLAGKPYLGPYPIVNCALNLNTGSELAKQERRAASFVFTPRYCGFDPPHSREDRAQTANQPDLNAEGYRATLGYMEKPGPRLGTTMAISGAAANPNSGYHTSAPLAFLMTILNVRLGWWLGNPRRDGPSQRPGPKNALLSLLSELFAFSNGRSRYVNVSDGGHFDNIGLYELVRRRCRYIIIGDSEADPDLVFEGLGGAIRKCRADFGVEITVNPDPIHRRGELSRAHCVVGTITYPETEAGHPADACGGATRPPGQATGWLLYLKSSLTGDETEDVHEYKAGHPTFPHESTADQFFTESQFESYRQLGLHVVRTTFENVHTRPNSDAESGMLRMFQNLCRKWYPTPTLAEANAVNLTLQYSALMRRLCEDPDLAFLDSQFFRGLPAVPQPAATPRKAIFYCIELIQLMEDVYFELNLQHKADRCNPHYGGWLATFRCWAESQAIRDAWVIAKNGYNPLFQEFFEDLRDGKDLC